MNSFIVKEGKKLRLGYTTGTCAAAATKAAAVMLFTSKMVYEVQITTPSGVTLRLEVVDILLKQDSVCCAVVKDGGDDPDATHGIKIYSEVCFYESGFVIDGGEGVGRVTLPGLAVSVGEAAINPVPRQMIEKELRLACEEFQYSNGLKAMISVPEGREVAKKTFNPRLGIVDGISILGTTGIVEPMSERALVDTIRLEMEFQQKQGNTILLLTPGNYGADFIQNQLGLQLDRAVKCSNFIGEALDYGVYLGFDGIVLVGHVGKLLKLAAGVMNTHSKTADGRMEILAAYAGIAGASSSIMKDIMDCVTTDAAIELLGDLRETVFRSITEKIRFILQYRIGEQTKVSFLIFTKNQILCFHDEHGLFKQLTTGEKI